MEALDVFILFMYGNILGMEMFVSLVEEHRTV
jgi:hypothetical protein